MLQSPITRVAAFSGNELRLIGSERAEKRRQSFTQLISEMPKRPQPVEAVRNFERGRATSYEQFTYVETAALRVAPVTSAIAYIGREMQNAVEHLIAPADPIEQALSTEEDLEHAANKQQRLLAQYIQTGNVAGIQSVIDTTSRHEVGLQRVKHAAINALRSFSTPARTFGGGLRA